MTICCFRKASCIIYKILHLGKWNPESDHRTLCIEIEWVGRNEHVDSSNNVHKPSLCMDFKKAPMYASMVEEMVCKSLENLCHDGSLEAQ